MSRSLFFMAMLHILLLLFSPLSIITCRPLKPKPPVYVEFEPYIKHEDNRKGGDGDHIDGKVFESCLPKGIRRSSAPSRYINDHALGSNLCSSTKNVTTRP